MKARGKNKCEIFYPPPSGPKPSSLHAAVPDPSGPHPLGLGPTPLGPRPGLHPLSPLPSSGALKNNSFFQVGEEGRRGTNPNPKLVSSLGGEEGLPPPKLVSGLGEGRGGG